MKNLLTTIYLLTTTVVFSQKNKVDNQRFSSLKLTENDITKSEFKSAIFTSKISFSGEIFQKEVNFSKYEFKNSVNFSGSQFKEEVNFRNTNFIKEAVFFNAKFYMSSDFNGAIFNDLTSFQEAIFYDKVNFGSISCKMLMDFSGATFKDAVSFVYSDSRGLEVTSPFKTRFDFSEAIFEKQAAFFDTDLNAQINFSSAIFKQRLSFADSNIDDEVNFSNSILPPVVDFSRISGKGKILFISSQMPNVLHFEENDSIKTEFRASRIDSISKRRFVKPLEYSEHFSKEDSLNEVREIILFTFSKKINKCVIRLKNSNLSDIILPYDRFWIDTTGYTYEEKTSMYQKILQNCTEEGMDASITGWSIELKKVEYLYRFPELAKPIIWFQMIFWNFGYSKWYIILWVLGFFLFFTLLNTTIYPKLLEVYFNPKLGRNLFTKAPESSEELTAILKNCDLKTFLAYLLHYTGVIFFGVKLEHTDMSFRHLRWVIMVYIEFVTGIILLGFTLNFLLSK